MKSRVMRFLSILLVVSILIAPQGIETLLSQNVNPSHTVIRAKLKEMALKYNIPSVILMGIAYTESGWRQFDSLGNPVIHTNTDGSFDIGIMQINSSGRSDIERLKEDIFYNIEIGAKILDGKWKITPPVGDRDRNVLENWYYAIWAYNGFSYTNHPLNPSGRRYQEKVLDNIARLIIGDDGQPLWTPIKISRPDPLSIQNPPQWIPTPVPYHFGDLYTGLYEGDNFRLLSAPDSPVAPLNSEFSLRFTVENIGTTTWKNSTNESYIGRFTFESGNKTKTFDITLSSVTEPGGKFDFEFKATLPEEGNYKTTFRMIRGDVPFGQTYIGNTVVSSNAVSLKTIEKSEFLFGEEIPFEVSYNTNFSVNATILEKIFDAQGIELFSKTIPLGNANKFAYQVGEGIQQKGSYSLKVELSLNASTASFSGSEANSTRYLYYEKNFIVNDERIGLFIASTPVDASIKINGEDTNKLTPSFIELQNGIYAVTLSKEGYSDFSFEASIEGGIKSYSVTLQSISKSAELSTSTIDFGSVYKGNSLYKSVSINLPFVPDKICTVRTSAKWLFVYPLSFNSSTSFTVSFDSRFLEEGANLNGTIYFNINGQDYQVNVFLTTLLSTSILSLSPQSLTAREEDSIFLDVLFSKNKAEPQAIAFEISYDANYIDFVDYAKEGSVSIENFTKNKGSALFDLKLESTDPEVKMLTLQFKANLNTSSMSSSVKFASAYIVENGAKKDVITRNSEVRILEKLVLPYQVINLKGEGLLNKTRISWDIPQKGSYPIKEFEVYRGETQDFNSIIFLGSTKANTFIDPGPLLNKNYYYWVITIDTFGNSSNPAGPVEVRPIYQTTSLPSKVKIEFYIGKTTCYVNGIPVKMEVAPFIKDSRTYVPVRYVAQPFGAQVIWSAKEKKVTLIHKNLIELWIGNPLASINGESVPIDKDNSNIVPFIIDGRTMLPLRFVSESFGAEVEWDAVSKKVTIEYTTKM